MLTSLLKGQPRSANQGLFLRHRLINNGYRFLRLRGHSGDCSSVLNETTAFGSQCDTETQMRWKEENSSNLSTP